MNRNTKRVAGLAIGGILAIVFAAFHLVVDRVASDGTPTGKPPLPQKAYAGVVTPAVDPSCVYKPTPMNVVEEMLELADVSQTDVIYDLGSGDGRIVLVAAKKYGCQAVGYEIDPELVARSRGEIKKQKLEELAAIKSEDIFALDLSGADVIALYLPGAMLKRLLPQFEKLKPGSRIVSHEEAIPGVKPDKIVRVKSDEGFSDHDVFLWTTPLTEAPLTEAPLASPAP